MALQVVDLTKYDQSKYNILVPTAKLEQISPFHALRVEEVRINTDPDAGDVYKVGSRQIAEKEWEDVYGLSKAALMKLASAAGIVWNWRECRVLQASKDYVLYQAVGAVRKPSGEWIPIKAVKEIDLAVVEEELREQYTKKAKKMKDAGPEWIEEKVRADLIQWRKNKLMRAETGAMLRVIRALLSLKHQYTLPELSKPFIVPRVDFSPDYTDPEVRRMILQEGVRAASELFSQMTPARAALPPGEPIDYQEYRRSMREAEVEEIGEAEIVVGPEEEEAGDTDQEPLLQEPQAQEVVTQETEHEETAQPELQSAVPIATELACAECGKEITQNAFSYSVKRFGKPLCYKCQQARKGAVK